MKTRNGREENDTAWDVGGLQTAYVFQEFAVGRFQALRAKHYAFYSIRKRIGNLMVESFCWRHRLGISCKKTEKNPFLLTPPSTVSRPP